MVCTLDWPNYFHNKLVQKGNGQSATLPPTSSCPAPIFQIVIQYPTLLFFFLRLKFYNDAIIKLGRAVRLWNEPSLCSHKWRKVAIFQTKSKLLAKQMQNMLADGVLNCLFGKWDFANTNQHSLTKVWIILLIS